MSLSELCFQGHGSFMYLNMYNPHNTYMTVVQKESESSSAEFV